MSTLPEASLLADGNRLSLSGMLADLAAATRHVRVCSSLSATEHELLGAICRVMHKHLRRGIRYRVLVPDHVRLVPRCSARLDRLMMSGASVRTTPNVPMDAVVVDDGFVVLPGHNGGTALFRLPSVVKTAVGLFERLWPTAAPLASCAPPGRAGIPAGSSMLTTRERQLLTLLSTGSTDEAVAAQLDISVRTVRRIVADIMDRLDARSRFQAGVKAADRGWLSY